jgi:hypothetical protein
MARGHVMKGWGHLFYHILIISISAAFALSLPFTMTFVAQKLLVYWAYIGNERLFLLLTELALTVLLILLSNYVIGNWRDRRFCRMAKAAGLALVAPSKGFLARRRIRKLKQEQGLARDVMFIGSTGFRTFVDPEGELHQVIRHCREAKIMLLNPYREGARVRAKSIVSPEVTPENLAEQIKKTIDYLRRLKEAQKNINLKLYNEPPFLKLTVLGDHLWLQYYSAGMDIERMAKFVFKHSQNPNSLYAPFYQYFWTRWTNPEIPEYDLETDELVYRDSAGNEATRETFPPSARESGSPSSRTILPSM